MLLVVVLAIFVTFSNVFQISSECEQIGVYVCGVKFYNIGWALNIDVYSRDKIAEICELNAICGATMRECFGGKYQQNLEKINEGCQIFAPFLAPNFANCTNFLLANTKFYDSAEKIEIIDCFQRDFGRFYVLQGWNYRFQRKIRGLSKKGSIFSKFR
ncbi:unnamed protein product [Caenorhabditis angaria]|uniref:DUF19 domain-containing protein n=1 Tax=Caenorhabditis angaria TaxID=860376 RepID=A0A9P1IMB6_9PELO|nr:unnamed protein product [Caenorhabditis angaria]